MSVCVCLCGKEKVETFRFHSKFNVCHTLGHYGSRNNLIVKRGNSNYAKRGISLRTRRLLLSNSL